MAVVLDQAGTMTRTVRDTAIMLESMAGYDPKDSTVVNIPVPNYEKALNDCQQAISKDDKNGKQQCYGTKALKAAG